MTGRSDHRHARGGAGSGARRTEPLGSLLLDEQLCFALYAASRAVTQLYRPLLEELGLTYPQYLVMLILWERERATVGELASTLELDHGTLSPLVKRLEAAGVLERHRRTEDERVVDVALTAAGRELQERAAAVPQVIVDSYGVDAAEFDELRAQLRRLTRSVAAATEALG
ncbi:MAG: MarR family winged helix-turn-helix transcriptional regulator [Solirubrobacteraceae bacterium]